MNEEKHKEIIARIAEDFKNQRLEIQKAHRRYKALARNITKAKRDIAGLKHRKFYPNTSVAETEKAVEQIRMSLIRMELEFEELQKRLGYTPKTS